MKGFKPGDSGDLVRAFQENLMMLGYDLPRFGADGWYGTETNEAANDFALANSLAKRPLGVDGELVAAASRAASDAASLTASIPPSMVDMREGHPGKKRLSRRPMSQVTGITLHQTATLLMGAEAPPEQRQRAIRRSCNIGVHHVVLRDGTSVWSNDYIYRMPQAQRVFNDSDVGIEIDGWYAGVEGVDSTFWKPQSQPYREPMKLTPEIVQAAQDTIRFIIKRVKSLGGEIREIHAHRQTSASRTSDPGELIWKQIAIPMMGEFGLTYGGDGFFVPSNSADTVVESGVWSGSGPGRPIPREWDPSSSFGYRDQPKLPAHPS